MRKISNCTRKMYKILNKCFINILKNFRHGALFSKKYLTLAALLVEKKLEWYLEKLNPGLDFFFFFNAANFARITFFVATFATFNAFTICLQTKNNSFREREREFEIFLPGWRQKHEMIGTNQIHFGPRREGRER